MQRQWIEYKSAKYMEGWDLPVDRLDVLRAYKDGYLAALSDLQTAFKEGRALDKAIYEHADGPERY